MQTQLRARLLADATIAALVGTRVDWDHRQQASGLPAITMSLVTDRREQHMGGLQVTRGTWVQFDCWAEKASHAAQLREAIVSLIVTRAVENGVTFFPATNIDTAPRASQVEQVDTGIVHRGMVQATIWHTVIPA